MRGPSIRYLVASPAGDIPVDTHRLDRPLEADPLKTPYRIYFRAIREFLTKNNYGPLLEAVTEGLGTDYDLSALREILVRTEKHGALYHPASIECILGDRRVKFGLHVAVTDTGKASLKKEFTVLKMLRARVDLPYIPKPYYLDELHSMGFLLEEWFEDFHEFHLATAEDGRQQIKLWEYGKGYRFLPPELGFAIYRQAAEILTLYYDLNNFRVIYPWHHAAGDFIVKIEDSHSPFASPSPLVGEGRGEGDLKDQIDVRLTTVRGYEPFMGFDQHDMPPPALALYYFLLHLSIQMRLDKFDGVGNVAWADDLSVDATVAGFLAGLERRNDLNECCGSAGDFLTLLKSFTAEDLGNTVVPIAAQFKQTKDYPVIEQHLKKHVARLYLILQNYPLKYHQTTYAQSAK
jgi:hypothetical protein